MKGPGIGSRTTRFVPGWTTKERLKVDQICTLKGQGKVQGRTGLSLARSKERLKVEQVFVPGSTKKRNKDGRFVLGKAKEDKDEVEAQGRPGLCLARSKEWLKVDQFYTLNRGPGGRGSRPNRFIRSTKV